MMRHLLIIEDSDEDFEMISIILKDLNPQLQFTRYDDGMTAYEFISDRKNRIPDLVFLDLNLPEMDGREFILKIKQDPQLKRVPIIAFTTSNNPKDVNFCYEHGINAYVTKPVDLAELQNLLKTINEFWFKYNQYPE